MTKRIYTRTPIEDRFWPKVAITSDLTDCWEWTAAKDYDGYGIIQIAGRAARAHIYAYTREHGLVPKGMLVCHACDNPSCVNSEHLFLGTPKDNMVDRDTKGRGRCCRGEEQGGAKLSWEKVKYIRAQTGRTRRELANKFGVNIGTIGKILRNERWLEVA